MTKLTDQGTIRAEFTSAYGVATQFGGLIVWEKTKVTSDDVERKLEATINQLPAAPKRPRGE